MLCVFAIELPTVGARHAVRTTMIMMNVVLFHASWCRWQQTRAIPHASGNLEAADLRTGLFAMSFPRKRESRWGRWDCVHTSRIRRFRSPFAGDKPIWLV